MTFYICYPGQSSRIVERNGTPIIVDHEDPAVLEDWRHRIGDPGLDYVAVADWYARYCWPALALKAEGVRRADLAPLEVES